MIPDLFTSPPLVRDDLETTTSVAQDEVVESCLPYLSGDHDEYDCNDHGVPHLDRKRHAKFLRTNLGKLPAPFIAADASRPWFLFWCLNGLSIMGEDISSYRGSLIETAASMQNETGGFGGGNGQLSHLATTYAVVLALALVGGEDVYNVVDRRALWRWLCRLKQPDGGFLMSVGGEEDIRGAYCATVLISLLGLPLDLTPESPAWTASGEATLFAGLPDYARRCQTFEGGIAEQPNAKEAHGAYAFCALGCLSMLDGPDRIIPEYLDVPRLISWLSSRQYAPEGGFSGRTNKLVDGCYSHWVGGCWPLVESILSVSSGVTGSASKQRLAAYGQSLFSREGLIRYILCCCQDQTKRGGLRDKPGRPSDAYHTCYVLSGLSSAQHKWTLEPPVSADSEGATLVDPVLPQWKVSAYTEEVQIFDEQDRVNPVHPVYTIPERCVTEMKSYFAAKQGF
ncbi:Protein farnesyltransferase subunit beta [Pleurostoma richardsiae]|uniref:Protein farnesyltransferase subunit beta n=1 Tax=Pleurostoma richardsiae TaxID=41990 RepID=A0AA38VHK9_9PEZI|nr:Protein farnesyltransferase subunit beta [Pleurostoma richardsiae]